MSAGFTPREEDLARRLLACEREIRTLKAGVGQGAVCATVKSSSQLVLTGVDSVVPGASIGITKPGRYFAIASADIFISVAAAGHLVHVSVQAIGGVATFAVNGFHPTDVAGQFGTRMAMAVFNFTAAGGTIAIYGRRTSGTASIESANGATGLVVIREAPV